MCCLSLVPSVLHVRFYSVRVVKAKIFNLFVIFFFCAPMLVVAQTETVDLETIYRIKQEGTKRSSVEDLAFWMTDYAGPRLSASKAKERADKWVKTRMDEIGLEQVRIEETRLFERGGWDNRKNYVAMSAPYYTALTGTPVAWTAGTEGLIKGTAILLDVNTREDLERYRGKLSGAFVVVATGQTYEVNFDPLARRYTEEDLSNIKSIGSQGRPNTRRTSDFEQYRRQIDLANSVRAFLSEERPAVILTGTGEFGVPRSMGVSHIMGGEPAPTEMLLPIEYHGRLVRLLEHGISVELEVEIENEFSNTDQVNNVIGEIRGTDEELKDEVVLIGAHWDSWHGGTGAADNASGSIVMLEAMRILKAIGVQPRRTIRIALWGGEEQGLNGSRGYVERYLKAPDDGARKEAYDQFVAYFNMDNGTGKFRGIYLQENDLVRPIFESWMRPFEDMGFNTISLRNTGGTDHLAFDAVGLPGFQFIQDPIDYGRGYHTTMDTYERLLPDDLKHNAIIVAAFAYHAAQREGGIPRKPQDIVP